MFLNRVLSKGLAEEMEFELKAEGGEGGKKCRYLEKTFPGSGNSKCKGPEVGACLAGWRNSKVANESGEEWAGAVVGGEWERRAEDGSCRACGPQGILTLSETESGSVVLGVDVSPPVSLSGGPVWCPVPVRCSTCVCRLADQFS